MHENHANIWQGIARSRPELTAVVSGGVRYDYATFDELAGKTAATLQAQGVGPGDTVAFYLHNTAEFLVGFYAALKLEATPAPINYRYRAQEIVELVRISTPKVFFYRASNRLEVNRAQQTLGSEGPQIWVEVDDAADNALPEDPGPEGAVGFEELTLGNDVLPHRHISSDAELYIFTGGTTGRPKAVVWGIGGLMDIQGSSTYTPLGIEIPETLEEALQIATAPSTPHVVTLPLAPFIHATALFMSANTLNIGGTVVVNPASSLVPSAVADLAVTEGVTQLIVAGDALALPAVEALENHPQRQLLKLNSVMSSGMRFSDDVKSRLHRLGEVTIVDVLASSEGGPFAMGVTRTEKELPARFKLTEEAVVLDEQNRQLQDQPGTQGVLAFRGALPKGYLNEPEKSRETYPIIDGVRHVRPGDYVEVLSERFIEFLGRGSSVINTGGEKVFPAEVEEALLEHPAVNDAVVFGLPDERFGESVSAVVALEDAEEVTVEQLQDWVARRLAGYKKPRTIAVRSSLDRTPAGKINMRAVKQIASRTAGGRR